MVPPPPSCCHLHLLLLASVPLFWLPFLGLLFWSGQRAPPFTLIDVTGFSSKFTCSLDCHSCPHVYPNISATLLPSSVFLPIMPCPQSLHLLWGLPLAMCYSALSPAQCPCPKQRGHSSSLSLSPLSYGAASPSSSLCSLLPLAGSDLCHFPDELPWSLLASVSLLCLHPAPWSILPRRWP